MDERKRQIEEMAHDMRESGAGDACLVFAEDLYEKGYRKQREPVQVVDMDGLRVLAKLFNLNDGIAKYETTAAEIKQLCGLSLEQLRNLLAAGAEIKIKMPQHRNYFTTMQKMCFDEAIEQIERKRKEREHGANNGA